MGASTDEPIINADWCLNGNLFYVSSNETIQLFNRDLKEEFKFSEKRNSYVIILEKDESQNSHDNKKNCHIVYSIENIETFNS